jgi:hypothetical protein
VAVCGTYALVHVEERFLPGFLVLFWLALYAVLWQRVGHPTRTAVLCTVLFTLAVPAGVHMIQIVEASVRSTKDKPDYVLVGEALRNAGIHQGDSLATAGGWEYEQGTRSIRSGAASTAYYAPYVGAHVVAAIMDPDDGRGVPQRPPPEFWHISEENLTQVESVLEKVGVKAIVALDRPADSTPAAWEDVKGTRYSILLLDPTQSRLHY